MKLNKFNAPIIAMSVAGMLAFGKAVAGYFSGSLAVLSSALDSLTDIFTSAFNYVFIKQADKPPDTEHPFGHGKLEAYASLIQSFIILGSGVFLLYKAVIKIKNPEVLKIENTAVAVMIVALLASLFLSKMLNYVAKKEKSQALVSDAMHYTIDLITNSGVLITLLITKYLGIAWVDPFIAGAMAAYIMYSAIKLHITSLKILLDSKISDKKLNAIKVILADYGQYNIEYHKLRSRTDGNRTFIDVHITMCRELSLSDAHKVCDLLEAKIKQVDSSIDITIHPEPCARDCIGPGCEINNIKNILNS